MALPYFDDLTVGDLVTAAAKHIHISDMHAFKACRRRWQWSSPLRDNLTPSERYAPFFIGSAVHAALQMKTSVDQPYVTSLGQFLKKELAPRMPLWGEEVVTLREEIKLIRGILDHYARWLKSIEAYEHSDFNLDYLATERKFTVAMPNEDNSPCDSFVFSGTWDGLARNKKTGELWLVEYKTARSIDEKLKLLANDSQAVGYQYAAQQILGEPVAGTLYTILLKKLPASPQVLKNGMLSRSTAIKTTYDHFLACIRAHHGVDATQSFIEANYGAFLRSLQLDQEKYFARIAIRRSQATIERFVQDFRAVAREMLNPNLSMYPTDGFHCSWCRFLDPCVALNKGDDIKLMLENFYIKRPDTFAEAHDTAEVN